MVAAITGTRSFDMKRYASSTSWGEIGSSSMSDNASGLLGIKDARLTDSDVADGPMYSEDICFNRMFRRSSRRRREQYLALFRLLSPKGSTSCWFFRFREFGSSSSFSIPCEERLSSSSSISWTEVLVDLSNQMLHTELRNGINAEQAADDYY